MNLKASLFYFSLAFSSVSIASASETDHAPSKYAVLQQQSGVCPYIPWTNLQKIRAIRERGNGVIRFQDEDYITKIQSYAAFLPQIVALDHMYRDLNKSGGDYHKYEQTIFTEGIRSDRRYTEAGSSIQPMKFFGAAPSIEEKRRQFFSPYNVQFHGDLHKMHRWVPILCKPETTDFYFYDYRTNSAVQLEKPENWSSDAIYLSTVGSNPQGDFYLLTDEMYQQMGLKQEEVKNYLYTEPKVMGFSQCHYIEAFPDRDRIQCLYDTGTYQHMLFACDVKPDNTSFAEDDDSLEAKAYREYHQAVVANPLNPWSHLNKEDLFEYQLAVIFSKNPALKAKAMESVNFFNNAWIIHTESFDLYDNNAEPRTKLSAKQHFMPGEDQMLSYYFSHELRMVWSASISADAVIALNELEDVIGEDKVAGLQKLGLSEKEIIIEALKPKYGPAEASYSFMDTWDEIKQVLKAQVIDPLNKKDMVSFSSHGSVISFDEDLIAMQNHEDRPTAQRLGFVQWDSLYDQGLKPFYKRAGTEDDAIRFE
jgi:hypothetical protein